MIQGTGSRVQGTVYRVTGYRTQDVRIQDTGYGYRIPDIEYRVPDTRYRLREHKDWQQQHVGDRDSGNPVWAVPLS